MMPVTSPSTFFAVPESEDDAPAIPAIGNENAQAAAVPEVADATRIDDADGASDESGAYTVDHDVEDAPDAGMRTSNDAGTSAANDGSADGDSPIDSNSPDADDSGDFGSGSDGLDRDGIIRLYNLERDIDYKIDRYRREGKDPLDLFDPSKPDYLGTPQALAPYLGGDVWLASNTDGNPPSRGLVFSAGDASADENTGPDRPIDAAQGVTDTAISEPDAAQDARAKAAERLARSMRAGGDANTNLLPLTLLLALPFAPQMAPAILEADGVGATLSADVVGALRMVWPKIRDAVAQLPQFVRQDSSQLGLSFDDFVKEIQTRLNESTDPVKRESSDTDNATNSSDSTEPSISAINPSTAEADLKAARSRLIEDKLDHLAVHPDRDKTVAAINEGIADKIGEEAGFRTFAAFKKVYGPAGRGQAWHHLVEQHQINVNKFGPTVIHSSPNLVAIPTEIHNNISAFYSSKPKWTSGLTVRDWIKRQPFDMQHKYAIGIIRRYMPGS